MHCISANGMSGKTPRRHQTAALRAHFTASWPITAVSKTCMRRRSSAVAMAGSNSNASIALPAGPMPREFAGTGGAAWVPELEIVHRLESPGDNIEIYGTETDR